VISASHNPHEDNGIKFFSARGTKLPDAVEQAIEALLDQSMETVAPSLIGKARRINDAPGRYIEFCKATVAPLLDLEGRKIVVDCAHGATYQVAPAILRELGAEVVAIGVSPDGRNINAGVGSTHPQALIETVLNEKAALGIALDGDGDRCLLVDETGAVLDGDDILFILAGYLQVQGRLHGPVVGTLMSNVGLEIALGEQGLDFERAAVGDRYVHERLLETGGVLGGESSGHMLVLDRTTTGDGMVTALQVLAALQAQGGRLSALRAGFTRYPQKLHNVRLADGVDAKALMNSAAVQAAIAQSEQALGDRGRVLLRPSGTEPLLRIMVEAQDAALMQAQLDALRLVVETQAG
jgi:phosphoglucosamine mutase